MGAKHLSAVKFAKLYGAFEEVEQWRGGRASFLEKIACLTEITQLTGVTRCPIG